ncbi:UVR domain [Plasmopara halstedii]|uniref:UVR domain n=1 Tax=Plasmopara halstedii TaxID=4781 RepID=A0A0P1ADS5_PLAHL|nr:UVR domain [Plasmopara halstedii]CEG38509.1 UVR domain [Plasmopara halstedii]|eukprot:XP_024574878.1 UVR domain [Plasmopara halstedii]
MFGRFFKNKEDGKTGPPGHQRQGGSNGSTDELPVGGGFFNLPPPVSKPYGVTNSTASSNSVTAIGAGAYPPAVNYNNNSSQEYNGPASTPEMFGGMSLRAPAISKPVGRFQPQTAVQNQYGGYGSTPSSAMPSVQSSGSLFNGLAVASVPPVAQLDDISRISNIPVPDDTGLAIPTQRKSTRSSGSSHHIDVTGGESFNASRYSRTSTGSNATSRSSTKAAKKKKKKTFRPGFGRQLSDESAAALQRGDLKEDDVISQQREGRRLSDRSDSSRSSRSATNPTDLAHLLPPVTSGSVLQGLTVHKGSITSSGGVLAGLTVHKPASPVPSPPKMVAPVETESSGMLSGLNIHKMPISITNDKPEAMINAVVEEPHDVYKPLPPPEPSKAPLTPEDRLFNTLRDFHESAVGFRKLTVKQNEEENRLLERKTHLTNQLAQYEMDLRDIEAQQHHACEVEDFEKADALNATINSVRHCITLNESDVRKVESEIVAFAKAKEKAFANQLKSTRGTLRELEKFREDQESDRTVARNEYKLYNINQTQQLQFEAERIESEMHHVSVSLENVNAEKSEIEATIEGQCSTEFAIQARLMEEKNAVEEEVRELEQKLKEKLERVKKIQSSIDHAQRDINTVRKRYSRQLKRIADREESIQKTKAEVESDGRHLEKQRSEFETRLKQYTDDISLIGKRIGAVKKEMRAAALLANVLEVQETRREQSMIRKKQQAAELSSLNDAAAVAEQSLMMLNNQQEELQKSSSLHRNAIASAEAMIPRLEQEKKGAAAQRNFKEAARISKDIKALEKDRSTAEEMVEVVEMELQDLKERIDKRQVEYDEKKKELKEVERRLELAALQELWKEAKHLRTALRKIERCKSEGDAATDGIDFRSSALLLVQAEYDACMLQVETFEKKYDVSEPTRDESSDDDDDDMSVDGEENERRDVNEAQHSILKGSTNDVDGSEASMEALEDNTFALEEITAQLAELESRIEQATENEEYDLAAKLDEEIESLKERKQAIVASMPVNSVRKNSLIEEVAEEVVSHEVSNEIDEAHVDYAHEEMLSPVSTGRCQEEVTQTLETNQLPASMLETPIALATTTNDNNSAIFHHEEQQSLQEEDKAFRSQPEPINTGTVSSIFGGLDVKSNSLLSAEADKSQVPVCNSPIDTPNDSETSGSLFGGLQISHGPRVTSPEIATMASASETYEHEPVVAPAEVFSPTSSNMKDSFFGQPEASTHQASLVAPSASGSLFNGMHMSGSFHVSSSSSSISDEAEANAEKCTQSMDASDNMQLSLSADAVGADVPRKEESITMFGGLQLSNHVVDAASSEPALTTARTDIFGGLKLSSSANAALPSSNATESCDDLIRGLQLSSSAVIAASEHSEIAYSARAEEESDQSADEGDTRMSIHELSEHESKSAVVDLKSSSTLIVAKTTDTLNSEETESASG